MNNKYYLAIVQNGTVATLFTHDDYDAALVAYHTELAYRNEARTSTQCAILNWDLEVVLKESYYAPTPVKEPEMVEVPEDTEETNKEPEIPENTEE